MGKDSVWEGPRGKQGKRERGELRLWAPAPPRGRAGARGLERTLTAGRLALLRSAVAAAVAGLEALVLHQRGHGGRRGRAARAGPRLSAAGGRPGASAGARRGDGRERGPAGAPRTPGSPAPERGPRVPGPSRTSAGASPWVAVRKPGPFAYSVAVLPTTTSRGRRPLQTRKLRHGGRHHSSYFPSVPAPVPIPGCRRPAGPAAGSSCFHSREHSLRCACRQTSSEWPQHVTL